MLEHVSPGNTVRDVLRIVSYDAKQLIDSLRKDAETALKQKRLTVDQYRLLLKHYEKSLVS